MGDLGDVYDVIRQDLSDLTRDLSDEELGRDVPATPGWSIRDIISHLAADATCTIDSDLPREFFAAYGQPDAVVALNQWTARQLAERRQRSLEELLGEWEDSGKQLVAMMRGEVPWPEDVGLFPDRIMITDAGVHQQDVYGALGIERGRDAAPVRIGLAGYVAMMGWRLRSAGLSACAFDVGDKTYLAGEGRPGATVAASRFELFRALSGRRNPEQIVAFEWDGDPDPYIPYFYPYGVRTDALVE